MAARTVASIYAEFRASGGIENALDSGTLSCAITNVCPGAVAISATVDTAATS